MSRNVKLTLYVSFSDSTQFFKRRPMYKKFSRFAWSILVVFLAACGTPTGVNSVATPSTIEVLIGAPETVNFGHWPMTLTATIQNNTDKAAYFEGTIWVGGPGWGGENYPYTTSDEYNAPVGSSSCNVQTNDCQFSWSGWLIPKSNVVFTLPTFSGDVSGTFTVMKTDFVINGSQYHVEKTVEMQTPTNARVEITTPYQSAGTFVELKTSQIYALNVSIINTELDTYHVAVVDSTCGSVDFTDVPSDIPPRSLVVLHWNLFTNYDSGECTIEVGVIAKSSLNYINTTQYFSITTLGP